MKNQQIIAAKNNHSNLLVGTGTYNTLAKKRASIDMSEAEIVTTTIWHDKLT